MNKLYFQLAIFLFFLLELSVILADENSKIIILEVYRDVEHIGLEQKNNFQKVASVIHDQTMKGKEIDLIRERMKLEQREYQVKDNIDIFEKIIKMFKDKEYQVIEKNKNRGFILAEIPENPVVKFFSFWIWKYKYVVFVDIKNGLNKNRTVYLDIQVLLLEKSPMAKGYKKSSKKDSEKISEIENEFLNNIDEYVKNQGVK